MDKDLYTLYNSAMGQFMDKHAKKYKCFFSHQEFEDNKHEIWKIHKAKNKVMEKLKQNECKNTT